MYRHGGHVGQVTLLICTSFHSYSPLSFHLSFGFLNGPTVSAAGPRSAIGKAPDS